MYQYFYGWYFKCQSETQTLAIIPAYHKSKSGSSCSIQLITNDGAWNLSFPYHTLSNHSFPISIAQNYFGQDGIRLSIRTSDCCAFGFLRFNTLSPIRYDIMGPFHYLPFMQCRHSVLSMRHSVHGSLTIQGIRYTFTDGIGYIEGDRGYSFPKHYIWTQCFFQNGSLMISVAHIPMGFFHFTGVIAIIHWNNNEYRLATYLGAKIVKIKNREIVIQQKNWILSAKLLESHAHPLLAPVKGAMKRTISESVSCCASYCFRQDAQTLFSFETNQASFEYEYPDFPLS